MNRECYSKNNRYPFFIEAIQKLERKKSEPLSESTPKLKIDGSTNSDETPTRF